MRTLVSILSILSFFVGISSLEIILAKCVLACINVDNQILYGNVRVWVYRKPTKLPLTEPLDLG